MKHLPQVFLGMAPRGNRVTEEHKVLQNSRRIDTYHCTDTTECGVLLLIVTNVSQCVAPHTDELWEKGGYLLGANHAKTTNSDGCILKECFGSSWTIDILDELKEHQLRVGLHISDQLNTQLTNGPGSIVAYRYEGRIEISADHSHKIG